MASPTSLTLAHEGFRVQVDVGDERALRWLVEFLAPWFEPTAGAGDYRVSVRIDPAARDGLPGEWPHTVRPFLFDAPVPPMPARAEGEQQRIHDTRLGVVYVVRARERCAEIVAPAIDERLRVAVMRTVRELATIHAGRRGAL